MKLRFYFLSFSLALSMQFYSQSVSAYAENSFLSGTAYQQVGEKEHVDPLLLYAISLTEAGTKERENVKPHIYAIRTPKGAIYPTTLTEAKKALDTAIVQYGKKALDVGLMQINGQHWDKLGLHYYSLFNPYVSCTFAARLLKEGMKTSPDDLQLAIGKYHSPTNWRAKQYGARVLTVYENLRELSR